MLDLIAQTIANAAHQALSAEASEQAFVSWAAPRRSQSTNASTSRINSAIERGSFENIHEWAARSMSESERATFYETHPWLFKRAAFEDSVDGGRSFFYTCLNLGDGGVAKFGVACVVFPWLDQVVVFPGDTLRLYWDEVEQEMRVDALVADALPGTMVLDVLIRAVHERAETLLQSPDVCHSDDWYIEVVKLHSPAVSEVLQVKVNPIDAGLIRRGSMRSAKVEARLQFESWSRMVRGLNALNIEYIEVST